MEFYEVIGRRTFSYKSKKDNSEQNACILGIGRKNPEPGIGVECKEYFINSSSTEVYNQALSLKLHDQIFPLERIVGNAHYLIGIEVKK